MKKICKNCFLYYLRVKCLDKGESLYSHITPTSSVMMGNFRKTQIHPKTLEAYKVHTTLVGAGVLFSMAENLMEAFKFST